MREPLLGDGRRRLVQRLRDSARVPLRKAARKPDKSHGSWLVSALRAKM